MIFYHLLHIVRDDLVFEAGLLLAEDVGAIEVRKHYSLWAISKQPVQLRPVSPC